MVENILRLQGITKEFPGVKALDGVDVDIAPGSIHGVVGENGAGKSTLMKIISGVHPHGRFHGSIEFNGEAVRFRNIRQSETSGIVIIHQELALVGELSVAENIFLGNERTRKGLMDWIGTKRGAAELLERVGLSLHPDTPVDNIGVAHQQLVEIAKALSKNVKLLILDEPTAALNEIESQRLLQLLRGLRDEGVTCVLISHKLDEIRAVCDSVTVIRDGRSVATLHGEDITSAQMITHMVGRELNNLYPPRTHVPGEIRFEVTNWTVEDRHRQGHHAIDDISLHVRSGEVVGMAGLMGAGRTEFAMSLFGRHWGRYLDGQVYLDGREVDTKTTKAAIDAGIAYLTEDRKKYGLHLDDSIKENLTLSALEKIMTPSGLSPGKQALESEGIREKLGIVASSVDQTVGNLSGGNQQKVLLGKWMYTEPDVFILDEPTRGVDVGAKYEIYEHIFTLAENGKGILVISSELPELLGICDRIYTVGNGRITGESDISDATQEKLMTQMTRQEASAV
ncbi:sugar ABC transporter ATP-binding protein [Haloglycomyces albus]|uniref:sugar ABC transporter ATP-binding protein n=1 Tax=Haloglycomyces albus TaxID=526067 RepID=UPI00046CFA51|nr:sugar ABC transporter ATP-binding protein [Haloglycomyces albus]